MKQIKNGWKLSGSAAILSVLIATGCAENDNTSDLRVIHASKDAPPVNVRVGVKNEITDLDYAESSGYVPVMSGKRKLAVEAIIPGGNLDVIEVKRFNFKKNERYNVLAIGNTADIGPLVVAESAVEPGIDQVSIAVVHASVDAGQVDVYVTGPGVEVTEADAAFSFDFEGVVDLEAVPAGQYRIQVTPAGLKEPVVYDSGTVDLSGFAGQKILLAAISSENETETAASPVKLLAATDSAYLSIIDSRTLAGARVVHLSPDAGLAVNPAMPEDGQVEVFASTGGGSVELIPAFAYTDVVPAQDAASGDKFVQVGPANYQFSVAPDGAGIGGAVFTSDPVALEAGEEYSVIAAGYVLTTPGFGLLPTVDDNRSIVTQVKVKVAHAAPLAGTVDVFVTPSVANFSTSDVESGAAGDPLLDGFEFGSITDYVSLAPGSYDIRVVPEGGTTAINIEDFPLAGGTVATVIARQADGDGDPAGFGVELLIN